MDNTSIKGRVVKIKKLETIKTKKGSDFTKQEVVIDQNKNYNSEVCLVFLADNVDHVKKINEGEVYEFFINISSREYNERHYTQVDCWRAVQLNPEAPKEEEKGFVPVGGMDRKTPLKGIKMTSAEQSDLPF